MIVLCIDFRYRTCPYYAWQSNRNSKLASITTIIYILYIYYVHMCVTLPNVSTKSSTKKVFQSDQKLISNPILYNVQCIIRIMFSRITYRCIENISRQFFFKFSNARSTFFPDRCSKRNIINIRHSEKFFTVFLLEKLI